ncbi:MAG: DUF4384 domain-containing protein [Coleofasciculus sp. S288]|nr:DUF4384 domain-containing protein [Coleofasciculus sp. S288]
MGFDDGYDKPAKLPRCGKFSTSGEKIFTGLKSHRATPNRGENREQGGLYVTVLVISPEGDMSVIFPHSWTETTQAAIIKVGQTRKIPDPAQGDQFKIAVGKPLGTAEVLVIASATPIREALKVLQQIAESRRQRSSPIALEEDSTKAIDTLLEDLDRSSREIIP